MAKNSNWSDEYWLLVMQLYLRKPVGVKPLYSRLAVELSLELHVSPQVLHARQRDIANLQTPRIERIWQRYSQNPRRLARAVSLLREMKGYGHADQFFEGVDVVETFEKDFRPVEGDKELTPTMLILILDLYFRLTPATMVAATPEVQDLAHLMKIGTERVVEVLEVYQLCDPYLNRNEVLITPLMGPCTEVWNRYATGDIEKLAAQALQLIEYFKG